MTKIDRRAVIASIFENGFEIFKYLATIFLSDPAVIETIKQTIEGWIDEGETYSSEDGNGNTLWDMIYSSFDEKEEITFGSFLERWHFNDEEHFDFFDQGLAAVADKYLRKWYREIKATKK